MILIISHKEDFTVDYVIDKLNNNAIDFYRFNCEDIIKEKINFQRTTDFCFTVNTLFSFNSVWFRRPKLPELDIKDESEKLFLLADYEAMLENIYHTITAKKWLSHPKYVYQAENKIYQLRLAQQLGFTVPDTLVTNENFVLKRFIAKHKGNVIIKPIRQGRIRMNSRLKTIFTNKLEKDVIDQIDSFDLTPCIFQEYIDKEYEVRVTVVGSKVFSARIDSQSFIETKVDWRKRKIPFEKYLLPLDVHEKCVSITQHLNISFGAIDLIKAKNGKYIFLEINPNGQWAWLETEAGLNISDEIIAYLTN